MTWAASSVPSSAWHTGIDLVVASIVLGCAILTVGAILQTTSFTVVQMIVGRFIAGIGNGVNTTTVPVWQAEISKPAHRGRLMVLQLALNQLGNVTAQWLNFGLGFISERTVSWRFPIAFQIFYAITTVIMVPWLPDSPRWLIQQGHEVEARTVIAQLYGKSLDDGQMSELQAAVICSVHYEMNASCPKWSTLLQQNELHTARRVVLVAGSQLMQQ